MKSNQQNGRPRRVMGPFFCAFRTWEKLNNTQLSSEWNSQNDKFPGIFFLIDIRPSLDVKKNKQLHFTMVLSKARRIPSCLRMFARLTKWWTENYIHDTPQTRSLLRCRDQWPGCHFVSVCLLRLSWAQVSCRSELTVPMVWTKMHPIQHVCWMWLGPYSILNDTRVKNPCCIL